MRFTKLDYCQYLLSSPVNYTLTNLAEHLEGVSHDQVNRYLRQEKLTPQLLWENVKGQVKTSKDGYIVFDDTVLDKRYARSIEMSRRQYSGCEHRVIRGIGLVGCLYVNAHTGQFWVVDYRLSDPEGDGKSKLDHVMEMLDHWVETKQLPFQTVLMDRWYAAQKLLEQIDGLGKIYDCPLKTNRLADDSGGVEKYKRIDQMDWSETDPCQDKLVKLRGFPKDKKVKLFRVTVSTGRTDYVATNDLSQASADIVQQECDVHWKIEEFHRELKQLTGIEACQGRKACIQRNHIACAFPSSPLRYTMHGDRTQPAVVFLHGFLGDRQDFDATFSHLSAHLGDRLCAVLIDLPGHGETGTAAPTIADSMPSTAQAIVTLLDQLEIANSAIVGYSMGGRIALYLALHYGDRFTKTLLVSASPGLKTEAERQARIAHDEALASQLETDFPAFLDNWYRQPLFAPLRQHPEFAATLQRRSHQCPAGLARSLRDLSTGRQPALWAGLKQYHRPLWLVVGERDRKFCQINQEMAACAPASKLTIVPNCGHAVHLENPAALADEVRSWLAIEN